MYGDNFFNAFQLNNNKVSNQKIDSVPAIELNPLVFQR